MNRRFLAPLTLLLSLSTAAGCQAGDPGAGAGTGGSGGQGPSPELDAALETGGELPVAKDQCPQLPVPIRTDGAIFEIPIALQLAGKVMRFGDTNVAADGETVTPLNVRFYLSNVVLTKTDGGGPIPVDIVSATGTPLPYGVHFYTGDDPTSHMLRVRAPAGSYSGIRFSFGLPDGCNEDAAPKNAPLSDASQMTWPHGFGFLFFRYEGRVSAPGDGGSTAGDGGDANQNATTIPTAVHMGGFPGVLGAPVIAISAPLSVPATGNAPTLQLVMDAVFKGATTDVKSALPIPPPPGTEATLGENLRQAAAHLTLFVLAP
ncbi:MAG TPA: MbnP family protein [Polyangia bacterium]|nr:MbnP family protein [Polyangia bacterium]